MAQISSISNGEALSSVRTKLNNVITEINLLDPTDWVDYSATSTVVGWSSFTTKQIRYRVIGKQVFVQFYILGTSNSTSTTFTLPNNSVNLDETPISTLYVNNGVAGGYGYARMVKNSNTYTAYTSFSGGTWTASGTKQIVGQFFYEIA